MKLKAFQIYKETIIQSCIGQDLKVVQTTSLSID